MQYTEKIRNFLNFLEKYTLISSNMLVGIWSIGVIFYNIPWNGSLRNIATCLYVSAFATLWIMSWKFHRIRWGITFSLVLIILYFISLTPQNSFKNTLWQTSWKKRPFVEWLSENTALIHNVRDFNYRSTVDFDERYISVKIETDKVKSVDFAVSHWDGLQKIGHTMLSFGFENGNFLALSMETRLPQHTVQGFIPGLYKQYEILPILATEQDLFKLRTNYRKEELFLYRTNISSHLASKILHSILTQLKKGNENNKFYNSLSHNCTTSLAPLFYFLNPKSDGDCRLLLNGDSDQLLYDMKLLKHQRGESFENLKKRRHVNQYIEKSQNYSQAIRTNL